MINKMVQELNLGQMELFTKVNILTVKKKAKENSCGQMDQSTMETL